MDEAAWTKPASSSSGGKVVMEQPAGEFLWMLFFDAIHHRGQLAAYLRPMGGKVPSIYGPSARQPRTDSWPRHRGTGLRPVRSPGRSRARSCSIPYPVAALDPPPGRAFAGTFHWVDDFYNYASFVQQAEDGRSCFGNKLSLEDHDGRARQRGVDARGLGLARSAGGARSSPTGCSRWPRSPGSSPPPTARCAAPACPPTHRFPALMLVGARRRAGRAPLRVHAAGQSSGAPTCTSASIRSSRRSRTRTGWPRRGCSWSRCWPSAPRRPGARRLRAIALGTALGLVRPYDLALLVAAHAIAVA